jgi:hypothetical protein
MAVSIGGKVMRALFDARLTLARKMLTYLHKIWFGHIMKAWHRAGTQDIVVICALHLYQLTVMVFAASAANATCIRALFDLLRLVVAQDGVEYIYVFVYGAVALALIGAFGKLGRARLAMLIPQQLVLSGMAYGGIIATIRGQYLDGTPIAAAHISVDQAGYGALCVIHLLAIIRRARVPNA